MSARPYNGEAKGAYRPREFMMRYSLGRTKLYELIGSGQIIARKIGSATIILHEEAERLEHAVSQAFEKKLVAKLGHKDTCPHGNGLSLRSDSERRQHGFCLLSEAPEGRKHQIKCVYERDRKLLEFLDREGLLPGTVVSVQSRNYDGTISVVIGKKRVRLGLPAAAKIWVARA